MWRKDWSLDQTPRTHLEHRCAPQSLKGGIREDFRRDWRQDQRHVLREPSPTNHFLTARRNQGPRRKRRIHLNCRGPERKQDPL